MIRYITSREENPAKPEEGARLGRSGNEVTVSRFAVGEADQKRAVSNKLEDVIHAIVELGGTYPDIVQFLQQAKSSGAMSARLEVDALPNPARRRA